MKMMEELYTAYRDDVYRYLVSLTHDPAWAEDLLSETFLQALQSIDRFEARSGEKTWLFGIARHLWLQDLRRRRPTVGYDDLLGLYVEDTLPDTAVQRELLRRIRDLLAQKDERTRRVVALRVQGIPYDRIAAELGISAGSARVIDCRARHWLKEMLRKEGLL